MRFAKPGPRFRSREPQQQAGPPDPPKAKPDPVAILIPVFRWEPPRSHPIQPDEFDETLAALTLKRRHLLA